jgi:transposase InsO family protein
MDDNYKTPLISAAITMAARNHSLEPGAIFHSDRGSNYTSAQFADTLTALDLRQSVGRTSSSAWSPCSMRCSTSTSGFRSSSRFE